MSWNEQTTSYGIEMSIDGYWHATRLFRVRGFKREGILADPTQVMQYDNPNDIPAGSPNLSLPVVGKRGSVGAIGGDGISITDFITVYAYNAQIIPLDNPDYTDVEYRYTNDPRLISTTLEEQLTFQTAQMSLPIGQRSTRAAGGGTPQFAYYLTSEEFPFKVGRFSLMILASKDELGAVKRGVHRQSGRVHWLPILPAPDKLLMKFIGADIVRYSPNYYSVRYSWEYDSGHPGPLVLMQNASGNAQQDIVLPQNNIPFPTFYPSGTMFVRPPYSKLRGVILAGSGNRIPPAFYAVRSDLINPDGYTELPGVDL